MSTAKGNPIQGVHPYLNFDGQCEKAFRFYEQHLGGKIEAMIPFADSPLAKEVPPDQRNKILHASIAIGSAHVLASDDQPDQFEKPQGFHVCLNLADSAEAERIFSTLADGGVVRFPIQQTFWAARFGMLVDQFGIPWMINCEKG